MKRKEWFKLAGLGSAAAISNPFGLAPADRQSHRKNRVLRIAHMTDPHLEPGNNI